MIWRRTSQRLLPVSVLCDERGVSPLRPARCGCCFLVLAPKSIGHEIRGFVRDLYLFHLQGRARRKFGRSPNEEAQHAVC